MSANVQIQQPPSHLIFFKDEKRKFVALKHDKQYNHIDSIGFFISNKERTVEQIKEEITQKKENKPEDIIEISFPWSEIKSIQSLVYKHKGIKQ